MAVEEFRKISSRVKFLPTEHPATAREHATAAADGTQGSFFIRQATKHRRRFELIRPRSFGQFGHRPIFPQPSTPIYILRAILYLPPGDIKFHEGSIFPQPTTPIYILRARLRRGLFFLSLYLTITETGVLQVCLYTLKTFKEYSWRSNY